MDTHTHKHIHLYMSKACGTIGRWEKLYKMEPVRYVPVLLVPKWSVGTLAPPLPLFSSQSMKQVASATMSFLPSLLPYNRDNQSC